MDKPAHFASELGVVPEFAAFVATSPWLLGAPKGFGRHTLVIPGFAAGDLTTIPLRTTLRMLGHRPHGWGLGTNVGPDNNTLRSLMRLVDRLVHLNNGPIDIVGWSLGGILARLIAIHRPEDVRQVVSLGSPLRVDDPNNLSPSVRNLATLAGLKAGPSDLRRVPVPSTSVFSHNDGVVSVSSSMQRPGPEAENVEVRGSHSGLAHNPAVVWVVADRLAQADDTWRPFEPPLHLRLLYPRGERPRTATRRPR